MKENKIFCACRGYELASIHLHFANRVLNVAQNSKAFAYDPVHGYMCVRFKYNTNLLQ